jgi:hypothetical protein
MHDETRVSGQICDHILVLVLEYDQAVIMITIMTYHLYEYLHLTPIPFSPKNCRKLEFRSKILKIYRPLFPPTRNLFI